jgi:hypothetical protein
MDFQYFSHSSIRMLHQEYHIPAYGVGKVAAIFGISRFERILIRKSFFRKQMRMKPSEKLSSV